MSLIPQAVQTPSSERFRVYALGFARFVGESTARAVSWTNIPVIKDKPNTEFLSGVSYDLPSLQGFRKHKVLGAHALNVWMPLGLGEGWLARSRGSGN